MINRRKTSRGSRSDSIVILLSDYFNHSYLFLISGNLASSAKGIWPLETYFFKNLASESGLLQNWNPQYQKQSPIIGRDFDLPRHSHYSGVIPMVFQHSGGRDFDLPRHSHYSGVIPMVFQHSGGRDFDLPKHSHYSGVIPMVFQHSERWAKKTLVQLEGKQGERGPDFDDDGYKYMICVEPAVARPSAPVELAIGESWTEGELLWSFSRELTKSLHEDVMDTCTSMISCGRGCGAFASIARK